MQKHLKGSILFYDCTIKHLSLSHKIRLNLVYCTFLSIQLLYLTDKRYIGCIVDQSERTLPYKRLDSKAMTNNKCASHCCSALDDATFSGTIVNLYIYMYQVNKKITARYLSIWILILFIMLHLLLINYSFVHWYVWRSGCLIYVLCLSMLFLSIYQLIPFINCNHHFSKTISPQTSNKCLWLLY